MARHKRSSRASRQPMPGGSRSLSTREPADETIGGGGGGRGGRARGTASRGRTRTTSESTGEVEGDVGPARKSHAAPKGRGAKADAPGGRKTTSARGSTGARKGANRAGASGTGAKKGTRPSSGGRRTGSRSGGGQASKKR